MGFFLTQVGILPETVETKDEELRKVYYSHKPRAIEMKLAHNYNYGSITDSTSVTIPTPGAPNEDIVQNHLT